MIKRVASILGKQLKQLDHIANSVSAPDLFTLANCATPNTTIN